MTENIGQTNAGGIEEPTKPVVPPVDEPDVGTPPALLCANCARPLTEHVDDPDTSTCFYPMRYRKKPVEVEAVPYVGSGHYMSRDDAQRQCHLLWKLFGMGAPVAHVITVGWKTHGGGPQFGLAVDNKIEGPLPLSPGDWIVRLRGEFYPVKPDIFEATYEPA